MTKHTENWEEEFYEYWNKESQFTEQTYLTPDTRRIILDFIHDLLIREREKTLEMVKEKEKVKEMKMEEAPPFLADTSAGIRIDLINKHGKNRYK
jgi:hypothetical protein